MISYEPADYRCPFCILSGGGATDISDQNDIVHRTDLAVALLAPRWKPRNPGPVLVVSAIHIENLYALPTTVSHAVHDLVQQIAIAMRRSYAAPASPPASTTNHPVTKACGTTTSTCRPASPQTTCTGPSNRPLNPHGASGPDSRTCYVANSIRCPANWRWHIPPRNPVGTDPGDLHHQGMEIRRVIVIFPVRVDLTAVQRFRSRWDPLAEAIPAHVTLVYPFDDTEHVHDVAEAVATVATRHKRFALDLANPRIVDGEYLFLIAGQGREQIRRLHYELYDELPNARCGGPFLPHMTIGRSPDRARLDEACHEAVHAELRVHGGADALSIYRIDPDGNRPIEAVLPLVRRCRFKP